MQKIEMSLGEKSCGKSRKPRRPPQLKFLPKLPKFCLPLILLCSTTVLANDLVYVRSNSFEQLITSSTMRWMKESGGKESVTLGDGGHTICRVNYLGLKEIGLLSPTKNACNVHSHDSKSAQISSPKYDTLTNSAARLIWYPWTTPNLPPTGAVAFAGNRHRNRYIASDTNYTMVGYLDPKLGNGAITFPKEPSPIVSLSGLVLTEIDPERYELYDIELSRERGFIEEEVILSQGHLAYTLPASKYQFPDEHDHLPGGLPYHSEESEYETQAPSTRPAHFGPEGQKGRIESVLTYNISERDNWGIGPLMAKNLPTILELPPEWIPIEKVIQWGIQLVKTRNGETVTASADLLPGTAVNMTLKGTKYDGSQLYWATLRTHYKDGFSSTRYIGGSRKFLQITNVRLEYGRPYFIHNGTFVPEPTTTTTSTTTTSTTSTTTSRSTTTSILPKSNKSRASEGGNEKEKEKMLADQHSSTETLTFSATSKLSGNGVNLVAGLSFRGYVLLATLLTIVTHSAVLH